MWLVGVVVEYVPFSFAGCVSVSAVLFSLLLSGELLCAVTVSRCDEVFVVLLKIFGSSPSITFFGYATSWEGVDSSLLLIDTVGTYMGAFEWSGCARDVCGGPVRTSGFTFDCGERAVGIALTFSAVVRWMS